MTQRITATPFYRPSDAALRFLPEGPYPNGPSKMSWVAIQHGPDATQGSLNVFDFESGNNRSHVLPGRPGFAFPCDDGHSFVAGCERTLGIFHPSDMTWSPFYENIDGTVEGTVINDGLVWENNLIFGTKDLEFKTPKAGLYLWRGSDGSLIQLRNDQVCSNGKAIVEVDGKTFLIDIDSPTRKIVRYPIDIAAGTLGDAEVVVDLTADPGVPDGAIVTPDGGSVIVSIYNPNPAPHGETRQYDMKSGELVTVWETPGSPQNTCPNLIEHDGKVHLVITTAVEHMPEDRQADAPQAGSLFIAPTEFESVGNCPRFPLAGL
ncbi:SMP-30/Gluconolaconase/LRE-like region [Rosistilla ulvae]|uniref:SMP-30/Gluconolaconase/LRE-like region n=1 Tax=Rosistilla ulvae TaxID=1930277 RepID=A0A517M275_9BACT|nr:SMP-30/gluconolactonase/LRE family protein [Rosistilla ulvae]QDS88978.1 SMP-30/Gluconolaconase/LRE-like region [Rosistilla ulvae]